VQEERLDLSSPTATGDLARTPFAHLLVYCLDHELTGTLVLQRDRGRHALYVERGVPAKASSHEPDGLIGQVLVDIGAVNEPMVRRALDVARKRAMLVGEALVLDGVLDRATLRDALRVQLRRRLVQLARMPEDTAFAFYQHFNLLSGMSGPETTPVEPLAAILSSVRAQPTPDRWRAVLEPMHGRALQLHPSTEPNRFYPTPHDKVVLDELRGERVTLTMLEASRRTTRDDLYSLLYTLVITRHLGVDGVTRPPIGASVPEPVSEGRAGTTLTAVARVKLRRVVTSPAVEITALRTPPPDELAEHVRDLMGEPLPIGAHETRRREVRARAESIGHEDFFTALGVGRDAAVEDIKNAFFAQAKLWHPDRIPAPLADVRPLAARVFARLGEAYQTLTDPERRTAYEATLRAVGPAGAHESASRALRASIEFQKAEFLLLQNDFAAAERLAFAAANDDGGRPEYPALGLWARSQRPGVGPERLKEIAGELDELVRAAPDNPRVLWYRARLLKRLGRADEAIADLRRVIALDPSHAEAVRELQEVDRRITPAPTTKRSEGAATKKSDAPAPKKSDAPPPRRDLWGKLFKK
jgi:curved DNA-binding protein CbpA